MGLRAAQDWEINSIGQRDSMGLRDAQKREISSIEGIATPWVYMLSGFGKSML